MVCALSPCSVQSCAASSLGPSIHLAPEVFLVQQVDDVWHPLFAPPGETTEGTALVARWRYRGLVIRHRLVVRSVDFQVRPSAVLDTFADEAFQQS